MKRFDAIYKDEKKNNHMLSDGKIYATEVRFDIVSESKERALELIEKEGENPDDFDVEETSGVKDQMGRYFSESIKDARI
jgi:hypothetical protein